MMRSLYNPTARTPHASSVSDQNMKAQCLKKTELTLTHILRCPCSIALCFGFVWGHSKPLQMPDHRVYCGVVLWCDISYGWAVPNVLVFLLVFNTNSFNVSGNVSINVCICVCVCVGVAVCVCVCRVSEKSMKLHVGGQ